MQTDLQHQLQTFDTALLLAILNGNADALAATRQVLANRGLDAAGQWVGFAAAERAHFPEQPAR